MLVSTAKLLSAARLGGYAIGAFNVYNLEAVKAVVNAAEENSAPAILQLHPAALKFGASELVATCLAATSQARVPMSVHLDHSTSEEDIQAALKSGMRSIMADGSHLDYDENVDFTRRMTELAQAYGGIVEAELGRLAGTEDGMSVAEYEARLTDPRNAADFVNATGVDALAVCIGNVHGHYRGDPKLDFERLRAIQETVNVPLVLHGASGLPDEMVRRAINLGITKLNVNTEVREAYLDTARQYFFTSQRPELLGLMEATTEAMQAIVAAKIRLFGSTGMAN
jgi:tagatose 1,6-diphosphate aldolase GatY/KbaY